jgi:hypothetical protein
MNRLAKCANPSLVSIYGSCGVENCLVVSIETMHEAFKEWKLVCPTPITNYCLMAYGVKTLLILKIWVMQLKTCLMRNYMEKGLIPKMMVCKVLVLIPRARKEVKMILENVMKRFGHMRILNNMKWEINKPMGVGMTM